MGHHVSAVDFSSSGLDKTRQLATKAGLKHDPSLIDYHEADVVTWQPTQPVDVVVMSFCHIAKDDKPAFFANLLRMLKPGTYRGAASVAGHGSAGRVCVPAHQWQAPSP